MGRKRHKAEEIIAKLRQVDVLTAQAMPVVEAIRSMGLPTRRGREAGVDSATHGQGYTLLLLLSCAEYSLKGFASAINLLRLEADVAISLRSFCRIC
jgi:hypothetical protein